MVCMMLQIPSSICGACVSCAGSWGRSAKGQRNWTVMLSAREAICQYVVSAFPVNEHEIVLLEGKGAPQQTTRVVLEVVR